jgi:CheY-like chemotaxis protein
MDETGVELDVLIVEDEPVVRSVMSKVLTEAGYEVTAVDNGFVALDAVEQNAFRAIVCDVQMPVMDGIQFYEAMEMKAPDLTRRVLFITAVAKVGPVAEFFARNACRVLEKPYELKALVTAVATLVGRPPARAMLL